MQTHRSVMERGLAYVHLQAQAAPKTAAHRMKEAHSEVVAAGYLVLSALLTLTLVGIGVLAALR